MMKRFLLLGMACFLLASAAGCAIAERNRNLANMRNVHVGMSKKQVLAVMGEPLTRELYETPEIWFYYTDTAWYDGYATRDECTPFVFDENGLLTGFGVKYYTDHFSLANWSQKAIDKSIKSCIIRW